MKHPSSLSVCAIAALLSACGGPPADPEHQPVRTASSVVTATASPTVSIPGFSADYTVSIQPAQATITHRTNASYVTTATGGATLMFLDRYVATDVEGTPGRLYRMYKAAFNRAPDEGGIGFWIGTAAQGTSVEAIAEQFASSEEFISMYGAALTNADFVTRVYGNVLGRAPDEAGHAFWLGALEKGSTRATVLALMADSSENRAIVNPAIANGFSFKPYGADLLPGQGEPWAEGPMGWSFTYEDYLSANRPYSYNKVAAPAYPVRFGTGSERFEVRNGDCGGTDCERGDGIRERSEVAQRDVQNYEGETWWYGLSMYIPPDYKDSGNAASRSVSLIQFHQTPIDPSLGWFPAWMFAKEYNGPFVARVFPSDPNMTPQRHVLLAASQFVGRWHDIVIEAKWSTGDDGYMRMWINDVKVMDHRGATRSGGNKDVYFKYGVYRPSTPAQPINAVVYFDEVRRAKTRAQVDIRYLEKLRR